jgi:phosphorylcholine metabolism protein LicD
MRTEAILVALISIGFYVYTHLFSKDAEVRQLITQPYHSLDDKSQFDSVTFTDEFEPRRFPLGILQYLDGDAKAVPITGWDELVNMKAKTELGRYWLEKYSINRLILMAEGLHCYDVKFGSEETIMDSLPKIIESIPDFISSNLIEEPVHQTYHAIELTSDDFKLDLPTMMPKLPSKQQAHLINPGEEYRYFKEGYLLNESGLAHYELRFYEGRLDPIDRVAVLHRIVRAWSRFTQRSQITTWIAHGSLLGYFFNGLIFPWDNDLDVQVTAKSFWDLVKLNQSIVIDYNNIESIGTYLIDINPWFQSRKRNPDNKIDARFIDLESGLYIDITTLTSEIQGMDVLSQMDEEEKTEFYKVFNPYHDEIVTELNQYEIEIRGKVNTTMTQKSLISCKDYHFYTVDELTPLIPTIFEGSVVMVPNNIEQQLLREYKRRSLYLDKYKGYTFDKFKRVWTHPTKMTEYNLIMEDFIRVHYEVMQKTFKRHTYDMGHLKEWPNFRVGSKG